MFARVSQMMLEGDPSINAEDQQRQVSSNENIVLIRSRF